MAYEASQPLKLSLEAGADLSALQYYFVKLNSSGKAVAVAAVTDIPIGVLQNKPTSGNQAEIVVIGVSKVSADAAVTAGAQLGAAADGQAVSYVAGTDTTKCLVGQAITSAGAAGVIFTAIVNCVSQNRGA